MDGYVFTQYVHLSVCLLRLSVGSPFWDKKRRGEDESGRRSGGVSSGWNLTLKGGGSDCAGQLCCGVQCHCGKTLGGKCGHVGRPGCCESLFMWWPGCCQKIIVPLSTEGIPRHTNRERRQTEHLHSDKP